MNFLRRASRNHIPTGSDRRPVVLFGLSHAGFFRNFSEVIGLLLAAGVDVCVRFSKEHRSIEPGDYDLDLAGPGTLRFVTNDHVEVPRFLWIERARIVRDALFYADPVFADATDLRARFVPLQKSDIIPLALLARICALAQRLPRWVGRACDRILEWYDRAFPPNAVSLEIIDDVEPDLVVVSPLVNFASREIDLVKAARRRGIPTLLAVASWDNLTNKGIIKVRPDRVAVWNTQMAREATTLHRVLPRHIWITGATPFDPWFERRPSRDRQTFMRQLGLKPDRPLVVYVCSSIAIAGEQEYLLVKEWLASLGPSRREMNVLVRPHPMALDGWRKGIQDREDVQDASGVATWRGAVIWPLTGKHPSDEPTRADFFDTLYHADAVVGLNTSAMLEAAILRKPVLTFLGHQAAVSQTGNLHFAHLARSGFVRQATSLAEHAEQLTAALAHAGDVRIACEHFVRDFIRPWGSQMSASAALAERIGAMMSSRYSLSALSPAVMRIREEIRRFARDIHEDVESTVPRALASVITDELATVLRECRIATRIDVDDATTAISRHMRNELKAFAESQRSIVKASIDESDAALNGHTRTALKDLFESQQKLMKAMIDESDAALNLQIRSGLKDLFESQHNLMKAMIDESDAALNRSIRASVKDSVSTAVKLLRLDLAYREAPPSADVAAALRIIIDRLAEIEQALTESSETRRS
jgi:hypothetical protein